MGIGNYILANDGQTPIECADYVTHAKWCRDNQHLFRVAETKVGSATVSTVFLRFDHQCNIGPPILWETIIFGLSGDGEYCERYSTYAEAVKGHDKACKFAARECN